MGLGRVITSSSLQQLVKKGAINKEGIRLLDCSYVPGVKPDWQKFREELYGKFDKLAQFKSRGLEMYLGGHIPGAVHADLDCAMYPGRYERFSHYPPEIFEEYIQRLGIDKKEDIVFYGRGAYCGMMFAARFAWLFRSYGHENVSLLDGGLGDWLRNKYEVTQDVPKLPRGNWKAGDRFPETLITFEQLEAIDGVYEAPPKVDENDPDAEQKEKEKKWTEETKGKMFIDKTDETNFLDARPRAQFEGLEETGLNQMFVDACHIPGFKNTPVGEMVNEEGKLKTAEEIKKWLAENKYNPAQSTVTICNTGMQASLLAYAMQNAVPETEPLLYSGSLKEMEVRDPKKISGGCRHIPVNSMNFSK